MVYLKKFIKIKLLKNSKSNLLRCVLFIFLISIIIFPKQISNGIQNGIDCCLNTLIPAMFPFMIVSSMLLTLNKNQITNVFVDEIFKFFFFLPGYTLPTILMSLFGGYPIGAYCTKNLYKNKKINSEQLNRMMTFCVNSGPAFIISVIGEMLLKSPNIGVKLFLIQAISSILIGIINGTIARIKKLPLYEYTNTVKNVNLNFSNILINSCNSTCRSLINMCSLVTLFFSITSLINQISLPYYIFEPLAKFKITHSTLKLFISASLEMTRGCLTAAKNLYCPYWIYSCIIGFGGICAHTQIIAELQNCPFKYKKFLFARILNVILTALITYIAVPNDIYIHASTNLKESFKVSTSAPTHFGSITLLIFCIMFTFNSHFPFGKNSNQTLTISK